MIAVRTTVQLTYWKDQGSAGKMEDTLQDSISIYTRAQARMVAIPPNENQGIAFDLLFKAPITDQNSLNQVQQVAQAITIFTETNNRADSDLRKYCDDDAFGGNNRWQPVPDETTLPLAQRNSQKTYGVDQEVYGPINGIRAPMYRGQNPDCKDKGTQAETFPYLYTGPGAPAGQNARRATMTVCITCNSTGATLRRYGVRFARCIKMEFCNRSKPICR